MINYFWLINNFAFWHKFYCPSMKLITEFRYFWTLISTIWARIPLLIHSSRAALLEPYALLVFKNAVDFNCFWRRFHWWFLIFKVWTPSTLSGPSSSSWRCEPPRSSSPLSYTPPPYRLTHLPSQIRTRSRLMPPNASILKPQLVSLKC